MLVALVCSAGLLTTGCATGKKNSKVAAPVTSVYSAPTELNEPSVSYLISESAASASSQSWTAKQWIELAETHYKSQHYARALRAAIAAIDLDNDALPARQIAMLAAVKMTEDNIGTYHDNELMNEEDKAEFKASLVNITTLVNASETVTVESE